MSHALDERVDDVLDVRMSASPTAASRVSARPAQRRGARIARLAVHRVVASRKRA
jgi:hypothetical protein